MVNMKRALAIAVLCAVTSPAAGKPPRGKVLQHHTLKVSSRTIETWLVLSHGRHLLHQETAMAIEGTKFRFESTVIFPSKDALEPSEASATTWRNGVKTMTGTLRFAGFELGWKALAHARDDGTPIAPPKEYTGTKKVAGGPLVLQTTLEVMAPLLLKAPGALAVTYAEFPDDYHAPELVEIKRDYRLVREPANGAGFRIRLVRGERRATRATLFYDPTGRCVAVAWGGGIRVPLR